MGACGGTAVELSSDLIRMGLLGADDPNWITWLGDKVWVWGAVALGVGFVIFVHELGHFLAAKLFGVKCEKFYVGFDVPITLLGIRFPRTLGKFRWGETEYGIGIIPLGGYVKMLGQDDDPRRAAEERERIRLASDSKETGEEEVASGLDPRSFPAKTVWQRMIIISAGVAMNVITGILFAALAFGLGVLYQPAVIGNTIAGYPAWQAGLPSGGRVISAGEIQNDPKFHFEDMTMEIAKAGIGAPDEPVNVAIRYGEEVKTYQLKTRQVSPDSPLRLIGIEMPKENLLNKGLGTYPNSVAAKTLGADDRGARVNSVDGEAITEDPIVGVGLASKVISSMATNAATPITLDITREDGSKASIVVPPQPYKSLGIRFGVGPVAALMAGGPAELAGVRVGDRIVGVGDDSTAIDAITLPRRVAELEGSLVLQVERGEGDQKTVESITINAETSQLRGNPISTASNQIELAGYGLTYDAELQIVGFDDVANSGSNSLGQKLQVGDELQRVSVQWPDDKIPADIEEFFGKKTLKTLAEGWQIGPDQPLLVLIDLLQYLPVETKFDIKVARGDGRQIVEAQTTLKNSSDFWYERGLEFEPVRLIHKADSVGEAFSLGLREAKRKAADVFGFLRLLFTGRVGPNQIGGPGAIVAMVGSAASVGFTKLLITLTLLSINLAILNFLPIPALDGGHMVFLIAEAVRGKPVDEELQARLTMAGVLGLLSLMVFVLINDYLNLFGGA